MTSAQTLDIASILDLEQGPDDADVAFFTDMAQRTGDHLLHRTHSIKAHKGDEHGMEPSGETNRFSIEYKYFDDSGDLRGERREDVVLLTPEELLHLLCDSGYEIEDTFGWYDRRTFSEGDRKMIVLARKKE